MKCKNQKKVRLVVNMCKKHLLKKRLSVVTNFQNIVNALKALCRNALAYI